MLRTTLLLFGLLLPLLHTAVRGAEVPHINGADEAPVSDPEIDRSPIWARMYAQYLFFLGREMFWPDLDQRASFQLAVVNWPNLAEELGSFLEGRSIAGMPVELVTLDADALAANKQDFTLLFLGGTRQDAERETLESAIRKWNRKGNRNALVITDDQEVEGHDLIFRRLKEGEDLRLCVAAALRSLESKGLELPAAFAKRQCP
ncbi:MAG: DUF4154 domain-containing protein [Crocinitomicaceae bacterium TMED114]|nr:MAG: DUF4154 domain-containing protein [Crocinitomicaceae bacterium TMED114]